MKLDYLSGNNLDEEIILNRRKVFDIIKYTLAAWFKICSKCSTK